MLIDELKRGESTVKRTRGIVAAMATLGVAVYLGSRLWAQAPAAAPQAPPQTRIALVNTLQVIKGYHKFKTFDDEMHKLAAPFEKRDKELRDNLLEWQKALANPALPADNREKAEKEIKERKRQIEDNSLEAKKVLASRYDDQFKQLYVEVEEAVKRYAMSNGFQLVLQFDERTAAHELNSPANIQRKLQGSATTGACVPLYIAPGLDITPAVISTLNAGVQAGPAPAPSGGTPPAQPAVQR
jgi:Skp family chaperone for outer membrane proteins